MVGLNGLEFIFILPQTFEAVETIAMLEQQMRHAIPKWRKLSRFDPNDTDRTIIQGTGGWQVKVRNVIAFQYAIFLHIQVFIHGQ